MKKFISMVMAAAMVVSLVPATAFAATGNVYADKATVVLNKVEAGEDFNLGTGAVVGTIGAANSAEVRVDIDRVEALVSGTEQGKYAAEITFTLENAEFADSNGVKVEDMTNEATAKAHLVDLLESMTGVTVAVKDFDNTSVTYELSGNDGGAALVAADYVTLNLIVVMDGTDEGDVATVSVESDIIGADAEDLVFAEVMETGLEATIKEVTEVGEESDILVAKEIKIESNIDTIANGAKFELELSNGFEFAAARTVAGNVTIVRDAKDYDKAVLTWNGSATKEIKIAKETLSIEAVDAKVGDECTLTIEADKDEAGFDAECEVVIVVVVGDEVVISVEDEDVPEIWAGTDKNNTGLAKDNNNKHWSLKVTAEESVVDAWDFKDAFDITLPEGVYVTAVDVTKIKNVVDYTTKAAVNETAAEGVFEAAYVKGDQENFEFGRKIMDAAEGKKAEIEFKLELVAEPTFTGDVVLGMAGQEVVIATFVAPYTVEAAQNDLIIDYRNTEVPTEVVITEAEAGLWATGTDAFGLVMDKYIEFDSTPDVAVDEASEMEIDADGVYFDIDAKSDDEAAVVTVSGIELYMSRSLAAGAYDLMLRTAMNDAYVLQPILGADGTGDNYDAVADMTDMDLVKNTSGVVVGGYYTVKEGWINIVTAGRDADDASFTTKVVVPVGEAYLVAGETTVALDVPAYVSAAGYTMLPVRAVAVALGIHTNNVLWDQATKTVTILYGQRIITMTVGAKAINVNGSVIPASSSPEVVDGRTFLPMRDLATALGVTDITWDAATKTATLNGNK